MVWAGLEPIPLDPESSALTVRPPRLPSGRGTRAQDIYSAARQFQHLESKQNQTSLFIQIVLKYIDVNHHDLSIIVNTVQLIIK